MPETPPFISVAIVTYNREKVLCETLRSVMEQDYPHFEIIVVDQTKNHLPETAAFLNRLKKENKIQYFFNEIANTPRARNTAIKHAKGEIIIFVDDDVELTPDFILNHVKNYDDEKIVAIGGKVIPKPFYKDPEGEKCKDAVKDWWWFKSDWDVRTPTVGAPGCNMSIRKSALLEAHGFDENFINECWGEETDVLLRLQKKGHEIFYDPKPALYHLKAFAGGSRAKRHDQTQNVSLYRNAVYLFLKDLPHREFLKYLTLIYRCNVGREKPQILRSAKTFGRFLRRNAAFVSGLIQGFIIFKKNSRKTGDFTT
jgi:GT2 family glycosyltransferase